MTDLLENIRSQCLARGLGGVKGLAVLFRKMDLDFSKTLCWEEFSRGMKQYGIKMSKDDLAKVFSFLDGDGSGQVDFRELLLQLRPPMSPLRIDVVNEAFDKMDANKDNMLCLEDMKIMYKDAAVNHPKYKSGAWSIEQVMQDLLDAFDSGECPDGKVSRDEFHQYYASVSSTVDSDAYFLLCMKQTWNLPTRGS